MKTLIYIIAVMLMSCEKENPKEHEQIYANWTLVKVTTGFSPAENYDAKDIVWHFSSNSELTITNNISLSKNSNVTIKESGKYSYVFEENNKIKIEKSLYNYSIDNNNLIISFQEASDGPRMEFVKIE